MSTSIPSEYVVCMLVLLYYYIVGLIYINEKSNYTKVEHLLKRVSLCPIVYTVFRGKQNEIEEFLTNGLYYYYRG